MYWQDERLSYNNTGYTKRLALNAKMVQHMWIPDIYFVNEKSGIKHDLTKENEVVRLWPDGRVFHSMRCAIIFYSVMGPGHMQTSFIIAKNFFFGRFNGSNPF